MDRGHDLQTYLPALLIALVLFQGVYASSEPQQMYSKIFLDPFYRASMSSNTNYTYNVTIRPDEGISKVVSAIVNFDMWITPTVTFNVWVNGLPCNNPTYVISTTFASSGRGVATFDCTNVINRSGVYSVVIRPTQANTGAVTAWVDLTYKNNPQGEIKVHGTEYIPGDVAKMFLQFLDANNNAVNNSECFLTVWYPNDTILINNSVMLKLNGAAEGIYYKNFNVPNTLGVYPASAKCYRPLTFFNLTLYNYAYDGFESNTWTGGTGNWSTCPIGSTGCTNGWDVEDTVPLATIQPNATVGCYRGNYCAQYTGGYGFIERGVFLDNDPYAINVTYALKFSGLQTNEHFQFWIFDGNWHLIRNVGPSAIHGNYSNNVWYTFNEYLSASLYELAGGILIGFYLYDSPSTSDKYFIDAVNISVTYPDIAISNNTEYQILRGSGEVHVSGLYSSLNQSLYNINNSTLYINNSLLNLANLTAEMVWNFSGNKTVTADSLFVGGTEYFPGDAGRIAARITAGTVPVTGATCLVTIAYPNGTSLFTNLSAMTEATAIAAGVYTYSFTAPSLLGVYTYAIDCTKTGQKYYLLDTFHVNNNTALSNNAILQQINITTIQTNATVTSIKNDTSLIYQIWSWVFSIFGWVQTDNDANATTSVATNIPSSIVPQSVAFVQAQYYTDVSSSIIAQVQRDGLSVTGASCTLNVYKPDMSAFITNGAMSFSGVDGMYNYTWTPVTYGSHIAAVNCSGGTLTGQVQASGSLGVSAPSTGYRMEMIT